MEQFTYEQFQAAEKLAIEVGFDDVFTPIDAIRSLTHCLFCIVQGTRMPHYTERQMGDASVHILQYYPLSEDFPYSNRDIIKDILKRRSRKW